MCGYMMLDFASFQPTAIERSKSSSQVCIALRRWRMHATHLLQLY